MNSFSGTILFVDISGFTPLSARLTAEGPAGVETLSTTLNDYFDKQVSLAWRESRILIVRELETNQGTVPTRSVAAILIPTRA